MSFIGEATYLALKLMYSYLVHTQIRMPRPWTGC